MGNTPRKDHRCFAHTPRKSSAITLFFPVLRLSQAVESCTEERSSDKKKEEGQRALESSRGNFPAHIPQNTQAGCSNRGRLLLYPTSSLVVCRGVHRSCTLASPILASYTLGEPQFDRAPGMDTGLTFCTLAFHFAFERPLPCGVSLMLPYSLS